MARRLVPVLVALSGLTAPAAATELTAEEIRDELVGHAIGWWEEGGWHAGGLVLAPDGRAEITVDSPRAEADAGRWTLEGNRICTAWRAMRAGGEKCYTVERVSARRFVTSGGNVFEIRDFGV
ncbi:hypothetical protein [Chthonobacter rhizosphaerae]|uniref:hypothetical protein n=1 Tax=Chthonobacter rhizosphaerae TaxID=2735553 RepID=UPI0015EED25A|nr:hypothetical protein [Chthonobacter rhizosphaerae]